MRLSEPSGRLSTLERRYLVGTFAELCRIESPSGRERACADRVIGELRALDVEVYEDDAGSRLGSDCGNLLARVSGAGPSGGQPSLLLCAHLDTVPLSAPVEPVLSEGVWENANEGILGADNKAAIAVILALARRLHRDGGPVDLELLFTVGEETALAGARHFDVARLASRFGYVFDHASPIGDVILASPSHFRLQASFHGAAAHAGIRPEDGRNAILAAARAIASLPLGRLDEDTTVNVGTIAGGTAMNVVAERCSFVAEVRSIEQARAEELVAEIVDRVHEAANQPDCDCDVDVKVEQTFAGYRLAGTSPAVVLAERALRDCGHEPVRIASGGASDANSLLPRGIEVINLANGTEHNHEPEERVSEIALEQMLDVAIALLAGAGTLPHDDAR